MTFDTKEVFYSHLTYNVYNTLRWTIYKDSPKSLSSEMYIIRGSIL